MNDENEMDEKMHKIQRNQTQEKKWKLYFAWLSSSPEFFSKSSVYAVSLNKKESVLYVNHNSHSHQPNVRDDESVLLFLPFSSFFGGSLLCSSGYTWCGVH